MSGDIEAVALLEHARMVDFDDLEAQADTIVFDDDAGRAKG